MRTLIILTIMLVISAKSKAQINDHVTGLYIWNQGFLKDSVNGVDNEVYFLLYIYPNSTFTLTKMSQIKGSSILIDLSLAAGYVKIDSHKISLLDTLLIKQGFVDILQKKQLLVEQSANFETIKILDQDPVLINNTFHKIIYYNKKGGIITRGGRDPKGKKHSIWTWYDENGKKVKSILYKIGNVLEDPYISKY